MTPQKMLPRLVALLCALGIALNATPQQRTPRFPFGKTRPLIGALHGKIYPLPEDTQKLPDFSTLQPTRDIYAYSLKVRFREALAWRGLPSSEWYAIDYNGSLWLPKQTKIRFYLSSDDGSKLYIDEQCVIDDDGVHAPVEKGAEVRIPAGQHRIRVSYFQGPGPYIALTLDVQLPGEERKLFDVRDFLPNDVLDTIPSPVLRDRAK